MEVLVGADPELFVKDGSKFVSAHGLIPGSKAEPHPVDRGAVQVDGMALEFNIDPAATKDEFRININTVKDTLIKMVGHEVVAAPTADFGYEYIRGQPFEARELGCEPDFNAYTGEENPRPNVDAPFRTGAGHIHIGWTNGQPMTSAHLLTCQKVVKELDVVLGVPSLLIDYDAQRRELYGQAGAYRPKHYGVEYRVLSNFWVDNDKYIDWVYDGVKIAIENLMKNTLLQNIVSAQAIINGNDKVSAAAVADMYNLLGGIDHV